MKKTMNIKLLKKIEQAILAEPRRLCMSSWVRHYDAVAPCGTVGCIAGHAVILSRMKKGKDWAKASQGIDDDCGIIAKKLLRISAAQAHSLFFAIHWPRQFNEKWSRALDRRAQAKVAAARIRHFIKTGE